MKISERFLRLGIVTTLNCNEEHRVTFAMPKDLQFCFLKSDKLIQPRSLS